MADTFLNENLSPAQGESRANEAKQGTQFSFALQNIWHHVDVKRSNMFASQFYSNLLGGTYWASDDEIQMHGIVREHVIPPTFRRTPAPAPAPAPKFEGRVTGPVQALLKVFDRWNISDQDAALFLGANSAQFVQDLRVGTVGLTSRDMQDRARLLLGIYEGVYSLLRDQDGERAWLNALLPALNNRSVLDVMRNGAITDLIFAKSYIDHINGR